MEILNKYFLKKFTILTGFEPSIFENLDKHCKANRLQRYQPNSTYLNQSKISNKKNR
jgi:hypothetical protein